MLPGVATLGVVKCETEREESVAASALSAAARTARNARLLGASVVQHLIDDPALFVMQVSRRLPLRMRVSVGRSLFHLGSRLHGGAGVAALGAVMAGENGRAESQLTGHPAPGSRLRSEVAVLLGRPDLVPSSAPAATRARAAWSLGDLEGAVQLLDAAGSGTTTQARRLRSELAMLTPGFRLAKRRQSGAAPVPGPEERVRVLHLLTNSLPHTQSGYSLRTHNILIGLRDRGIDSVALTRTGYPVMVGKPLCADVDVVDGIEYRRTLPTRLGMTPTERLEQEVDEALRIVREFRPHVLHATTDYRNALVAQAVSAATGIPWIFEVRGLMEQTWIASHPSEELRRRAARSEKVQRIVATEGDLVRTASSVVTLSRTMADVLVRRGVPADRIVLVPNGIDTALLRETMTPRQARAHVAADLPADTLAVGAVSALVDYEGFDTLLHAAAQIIHDDSLPRQVRDRLHVVLVGDGSAAPALAESARELGLADRILMPGRVPRSEARLWVQALDLVVVPRRDLDVSRTVTPQKPVEAMALGRPVVVSDLPALRETVTDAAGRVHGTLVPPDDPRALAEAVAEHLVGGAPPEGERAAARRAAQERTWPVLMARYELAYCGAVQKSFEENHDGE
ncbi:glycosyltransferase WbuB [Brachybacterium conglomeratum]|uniref:Glycosyl transferase family 1 n=2 Tax=Brachybacterium TaxID=43668 RepID=A0A3R8RQN3_9MICO|nr:glycosyl transferase family 1 [Brachybacterium paraconglomeratum]GLI30080.1 glycosyltransferase WbuB [Brachybacterium conglomeratum]GLK04618.1 glycosyltransferase WbuB [Brachybacterium conglomeratum]